MSLTQRLLLGTLASILLLVAAIVVIAGSRLSTSLAEDTRSGLTREARLVRALWIDPHNADAIADSAGKALDHRVTLIDSAGVVRGDSRFDGGALRTLENHSAREEIRLARDSGAGCASRVSASEGDEEMYCAVRHPLGFARVSIQTASFRDIVSTAQTNVLVAGLLAMVGAMLLAYLFSRSISRPIVELRNVARSIAQGDLQRRPTLSAPGEIGDLAAAVHRMAEQLAARLQALEREETLTLALIESLDEGIVAVDARGEVVRLNASARRLLGVNDVPPFRDDRLPPERSLREALRRAMRGEPSEGGEIVLYDRTLAVTARPLPNGGAVLAVLDLTARRRLETIRRDFVANVSHELKTPLTVIAGFTETLSDSDLSPAQRADFIEKIVANTSRMQRIVDDLLDLARYETGGWTPQISDVDANAIVNDVFTILRPAATERGIQLEARIDPTAATVQADPTAVRQVIVNLVDNAIRHTSEGAVTVRASRDSSGRGVWLSVSDTGSGIPAEHLPRIFERFYRVDPGRSRNVGGTGLGLSIVRHLVEAHGGEVRAESTVGKGTTISVLLPVRG